MLDDDRTRPADERIEHYQRQLRRLASELSLTEARERREIASDLHDHIGQALAFVSQKVSALKGDAIFSGRDGDFEQILSILGQAIRYTRDLTVEISPPVLYELGLSSAIEWIAERSLERFGLEVIFTESGEPSEVSEEVRVFVFKSLQELVNNAVKHSGAKKVDIRAEWGTSRFEITISDEGNGFDTSEFESGLHDGCCFGLFSIRERLSYIGGGLVIDSSPGEGTRVRIAAPYSAGEGERK